MAQQNLLQDLETVLQQDQTFISDGTILKNAVIEAALKMDPKLLALLLQSEPIKAHFFTEVAGVLVFDKVRFQDFVSNKAFLPDSYTAFRNRIGLTTGRDHISQSRDVVLSWPYKDCVLEGGMTKEDQGRDEVFWNTTLAPDDITRLFEPKVLTGWERWDAEAVQSGKAKPVGAFQDTDNLLIKGNNLLALQSLKTGFRDSAKLVYIDPPFNTGSDSFKYNDKFNHSSWLTFMKNRLEAAKLLMARNGYIVVQTDDRETAYLKVLMDEVFGRENYLNTIAVKTNSAFGFKGTSDKLFKQASFLLLYAKDLGVASLNRVFEERDYDPQYKWVFKDTALPETEWTWESVREATSRSLGFNSTKDAEKKLGKKGLEAKVASYALNRADHVFRTASVTGGALKKRSQTIKKSSASPNEIVRHPNDDMDYMFIGGERVLFYSERVVTIDGESVAGEIVTDMWSDMSIEGIAKEGGIDFPKGKKPESLLRRLIELTTSTGDLVLDFFAGSGTTAATSHKLGRRWISIEQLDYINELPVNRVKNVLSGDKSGISKAVNWKGGGSFVYAELASFNASFAAQITDSDDSAALLAVYDAMQATGYLRHDIDLSKFNTTDFAVLPLADQKRVLMDCLDANHLYVNLGSLGDEAFQISEEDAKATRAFYGVAE